MKNEHVVTLKTDANCAWIAVLDPASGRRGRYTVYRLYRWAEKRADIVGREVDLATARKLAGKRKATEGGAQHPGLDHHCDWRKAALMLAKCVATTLQTGGKIGMGSGMVMKRVDGKTTIERWDKDFVEALAFIGIEMVDKVEVVNKKPKRSRSRGSAARAVASGARAAGRRGQERQGQVTA